MTTPNDAARPVAKIRVGGGPDPSTVMWITDNPPTTPILVYTAADYDALREEVERLRVSHGMEYLLVAEATARAEAAEAKVAKLTAFAHHARETAFDFVNNDQRPWPHHMRELAWKADAALNEGGE